MRDISGLVQKATSQHGLLTTTQLRALGCSESASRTLVRRGVLDRVRPGVVRVVGAPITYEQRLHAVLLSSGGKAAASHHSALRLWGLRDQFSGLEVTVRYPADCRLPGVRVHRSSTVDDEQIATVGGIAVTTMARTVVDVANSFPPRELGRIVAHASATGLLAVEDLTRLRRALGGPGRHGIATLDRVLTAIGASDDADSGPEVQLGRLLVDAGPSAPIAQHRVLIGGRRYRIDLAYPEARLAIEYDGFAAHSGHGRFEDDRRRQNDLVRAGWRILRFTARDLREDRRGVVDLVRTELRRPPPGAVE